MRNTFEMYISNEYFNDKSIVLSLNHQTGIWVFAETKKYGMRVMFHAFQEDFQQTSTGYIVRSIGLLNLITGEVHAKSAVDYYDRVRRWLKNSQSGSARIDQNDEADQDDDSLILKQWELVIAT